MRHVVDTNALILNPDIVDEYEDIVISHVVLDELDRIKIESGERGQGARRAVRKLMDTPKIRYDLEVVPGYTDVHPDKAIIDTAVRHKATVITGDYLMLIRAKAEGLNVINIFGKTIGKPDYSGYVELDLTDEEVANYYSNEFPARLKELTLYPNQYVLLKSQSEGKHIDLLKVTTDLDLVKVKSKTLQSEQLGKFVPKDFYQIMALDSVISNQMTIIKGKAGSGKSLLALSYAFNAIETGVGKGKEKEKYEKLICFVNPVSTKNAAKLGYFPGNPDEKLLHSYVGSMLASKLGSKQEVEKLIEDEKLVLLPFSDIRGYDTTGMKAIVYIMEAQNLDIDLMKLATQRVGEDSKLIIDGDNQQQVDNVAYAGMQNGMRRASEVFRGEGYFGEVELPNIYRSRIAKKADDM